MSAAIVGPGVGKLEVTPQRLDGAKRMLAMGYTLREAALSVGCDKGDLDLALWRSTGGRPA